MRNLTSQQIRKSQFVISYGPGAILEGKTGPRVIPRPDLGLFSQTSGLRPSGFEIPDHRFSQGLLQGKARIFYLPSNAELGEGSDRYVYSTKAFPDWRLCSNERAHKGGSSVLHNNWKGCPSCGGKPEDSEPIRFIRACRKGHMDDIDWHYVVHRGSTGCQHSGYLNWIGGGGALNDIAIQCPRCGARKTMGWAYGQHWPCSGRHPERDLPRGQPLRSQCDAKSLIIQRQASNLRIPELKTLLTIPPRETALHDMLQKGSIYTALAALGQIDSKKQLETILNNLANKNLISHTTLTEILAYDWPELSGAIEDTFAPVASTYEGLILEEFHAFIEASTKVMRPVRGPPPRSPVIFKVNPHHRQVFKGRRGTGIAVTPVEALRTVTIQTGYRREVDTDADTPAEPVNIGFTDWSSPEHKWYPGVEFLGEGIFLNFDKDAWHFNLQGADEWLGTYNDASAYPKHVFRATGIDRDELHPVFVWWHTFSHLLIRSVSLEAGYSSAAIRERIYFERDGDKAKGGILLYATQPGSEGSLGGLVALVPYFDEILESAFSMMDGCSGDPLCIENRFAKKKYNGSACYGCLLISETSCEHRNMWLDRRLLLENAP